MTTEETSHIDKRFDSLEKSIKELATETAEIKRGVYGDAKNQVPGLIQTDRNQDERLTSLENTRSKFIWWTAGALAAVEGVWHWIKG
jgi:hypothetical protein